MYNQNVCDKVYIRKGNSPNYKLKSQKKYLVNEELMHYNHSGCRLGSSHHLKKA